MEKVLMFLVFFIIIYLIYYFIFIRKQIKYKKDKVFSDVKILEGYYNIDVKKIGYQRVLRILNFTNALMLSIIMIIVSYLDKFIYKILIIVVLIIPFIWVTYYFLSKYLKYLERKSE